MIKQDRVFLAIWRDNDIVIFANNQGRDGRLEWLSVARSSLDINADSFVSLGRIPLNEGDLSDFAELAITRRAAFSNYQSLPNVSALESYLDESGDLLELCGYFSFLRKYAVDGQQIRRYLATEPSERFSLEMGLSINRLLFDRYDIDKVANTIHDDIPLAESSSGSSAEKSEYFRSAARLYEMIDDFGNAAELMSKSATFAPSDDKYRKMGDYYFQAGDTQLAIESFKKAETIAALPIPSAFRLGKILFESDRYSEARPYLELAAERFPAPCSRMIAEIENKLPTEHETELG